MLLATIKDVTSEASQMQHMAISEKPTPMLMGACSLLLLTSLSINPMLYVGSCLGKLELI